LPGITNRLLSKKVDKVFVAYPGMDRFFPADKISYLGNPVRSALVNPSSGVEEARVFFGLNASRKTVLVFGGSLGAGILNECMEKANSLIADHPEIQWIWQTGAGYEDIYKDSKTGRLPNVRKLTFIDRMDLAYLACDLVVCRAGALTISEICLLGKASILIPSPFVAEDHQTVNAKALADVEAAILVSQNHAGDKLIPLALETVSNDELIEKIEKNAKALGMPDADENIASALLEMIRKKENG
jgi:UDP-N-acetylglucosamine--N-acetylmuramyl-(pentapeptide) pyrophosphoryl-undecaprenol N-acetylglucosamine transferase